MFDATGFSSSPRLLACGFGPFPGAELNPTQALVQTLAAEGWSPSGARLATALLPVAWSGAVEAALRAAEEARADAIVLFGVSAEATCVRVETLARNRADPDRLDAQGYCWPGRRLSPTGPEAREVTLPAWRLVGAIAHEGIACAPSEDAGDYLCNRTLWGVLAAGGAKAIFVHVPMPRETAAALALPCPSGLSLADLVKAAKAALSAASATLSEQSGAHPTRAA
jgi:pyroglutamyl-peptidase